MRHQQANIPFLGEAWVCVGDVVPALAELDVAWGVARVFSARLQ
jgi:hypothetical protein